MIGTSVASDAATSLMHRPAANKGRRDRATNHAGGAGGQTYAAGFRPRVVEVPLASVRPPERAGRAAWTQRVIVQRPLSSLAQPAPALGPLPRGPARCRSRHFASCPLGRARRRRPLLSRAAPSRGQAAGTSRPSAVRTTASSRRARTLHQRMPRPHRRRCLSPRAERGYAITLQTRAQHIRVEPPRHHHEPDASRVGVLVLFTWAGRGLRELGETACRWARTRSTASRTAGLERFLPKQTTARSLSRPRRTERAARSSRRLADLGMHPLSASGRLRGNGRRPARCLHRAPHPRRDRPPRRRCSPRWPKEDYRVS